MIQYGAFAHSYDQMMHDVDYVAWAAYLDSFLKEHHVRTVIDCACGTGMITVALAKAGYTMIGTDISEDMLMEARMNALKNGLRFLPFVCQDMTVLEVHHPVDAVISTCDGINYLTEKEDADRFFQRVWSSLKPGGLLLFDLSSVYKMEKVLGNETFTEITEDYAYIWSNAFDPEINMCGMDLTFFVRDGEIWRRFTEQHLQRAYRESELKQLLERNGFEVVGVYDAFSREPVKADSERIQFVARKI